MERTRAASTGSFSSTSTTSPNCTFGRAASCMTSSATAGRVGARKEGEASAFCTAAVSSTGSISPGAVWLMSSVCTVATAAWLATFVPAKGPMNGHFAPGRAGPGSIPAPHPTQEAGPRCEAGPTLEYNPVGGPPPDRCAHAAGGSRPAGRPGARPGGAARRGEDDARAPRDPRGGAGRVGRDRGAGAEAAGRPHGGSAGGGGAGRAARRDDRLAGAVRGRNRAAHAHPLPDGGPAHPAAPRRPRAPRRGGGGAGRVPRAPPRRRSGAGAPAPAHPRRSAGPQAGGDVGHAPGRSGGALPRRPGAPLGGPRLPGGGRVPLARRGGARPAPGRARGGGGEAGPARGARRSRAGLPPRRGRDPVGARGARGAVGGGGAAAPWRAPDRGAGPGGAAVRAAKGHLVDERRRDVGDDRGGGGGGGRRAGAGGLALSVVGAPDARAAQGEPRLGRAARRA